MWNKTVGILNTSVNPEPALSLTILLYANCLDPDEMPNNLAFHQDSSCSTHKSTFLQNIWRIYVHANIKQTIVCTQKRFGSRQRVICCSSTCLPRISYQQKHSISWPHVSSHFLITETISRHSEHQIWCIFWVPKFLFLHHILCLTAC